MVEFCCYFGDFATFENFIDEALDDPNWSDLEGLEHVLRDCLTKSFDFADVEIIEIDNLSEFYEELQYDEYPSLTTCALYITEESLFVIFINCHDNSSETVETTNLNKRYFE